MNRKVYRRFIREATSLVRACEEIHELAPILENLPKSLVDTSDRQLIISASAYVNALEHLVEKMTDEFLDGRAGKWSSTKAVRLLKCFASGHIPNRL
jgi:hypothetical protein